MNIPSCKIEEMTQSDLDALIAAYNGLRNMFDETRRVAENIFVAGIGVEVSDPRFHRRMAAHEILTATTIKEHK